MCVCFCVSMGLCVDGEWWMVTAAAAASIFYLSFFNLHPCKVAKWCKWCKISFVSSLSFSFFSSHVELHLMCPGGGLWIHVRSPFLLFLFSSSLSFMHSYRQMQNTLDLTFMSDESLMSLLLVSCLLMSYSLLLPSTVWNFGNSHLLIFLFLLRNFYANSANVHVCVCRCGCGCKFQEKRKEKHATVRAKKKEEKKTKNKQLNIMRKAKCSVLCSINQHRTEGRMNWVDWFQCAVGKERKHGLFTDSESWPLEMTIGHFWTESTSLLTPLFFTLRVFCLLFPLPFPFALFFFIFFFFLAPFLCLNLCPVVSSIRSHYEQRNGSYASRASESVSV